MSWSCRYFTPDNTELGGGKGQSLVISLACGTEGDANVPKHGDGISLREMAVLDDALEELSADESEVVFCPGLEPFIEFDLRGKTNTSGDK